LSVNKEFISKLLKDIEESVEAIKEYVSKPYTEISRAEKLAIRYHLIVIAEALMTAILHIVRRVLNFTPETPMHALSRLREEGLISDEEFKDVINIIRLRNLLVHRYWVVDDRVIYENVVRDFSNVIAFINRLRKYVSKI